MRILWSTTHDRGAWYPIAPVVAGLVAAGHDVVASGQSMAAVAATALDVPFVAEDLVRMVDTEIGPSTGFDGLLDRRIRTAAVTFATLRSRLSGGAFDAVLADPFRYGAGLAARAEGVPWVSYLHHCYFGDPIIDGLFQMSWDGDGNRDNPVGAYREWWSGLRAHLGLDIEDRPEADAWRYAISDRLTLVLGSRRLTEAHLPAGGVAIGATPWETPEALPSDLHTPLKEHPVMLVAPPARLDAFPFIEIAEAANEIGASLLLTAPESVSLPPLPGRVTICRSLPHTKVMPFVDAVICGGGWGTTTKALAAGVPVVVIPHGLDTENTGRAIESSGCGVTITGDC